MQSSNRSPQSIPELGEIQNLIEEIMPAPEQPAQRRNGTNGKHEPTGISDTGTVMGAFPLAGFLEGVNWANRAGYRSPFRRSAGSQPTGPKRVLGAVPLAEFLVAVNWKNHAAAPGLELHTNESPDAARLVLDTFMNEIQWE
jgi:hypothetical protein